MDCPGGTDTITSVLESARGQQKEKSGDAVGDRLCLLGMALKVERQDTTSLRNWMVSRSLGRQGSGFSPGASKQISARLTL